LHFNGFCVKQTVYGLKLMTLPYDVSVFFILAQFFRERNEIRPIFSLHFLKTRNIFLTYEN